ncbi:MAG: SET domain-containing protein [Bacteroidota bacterium]
MLYVKKSKIPKSGKGLWTSIDIKKGGVVCEYEGEKLTWKECLKRNEALEGFGAYYFYITSKNCIDAQNTLWSLGRYANDAAGFGRIDGLRNNSCYEIRKGKPYIVASRNIKANEEIFVGYGKEYWEAIKEGFEKKKKTKK